MGAMSAYGVSCLTGSPWLGVLVAARRRRCCSAPLHGWLCQLPRVNDIAVGIAPDAVRHRPRLLPRQAVHPAHGAAACRRIRARLAGATSRRCSRRCRSTCCSSSASCWRFALAWALKNTRWGLILRIVGESADAARAMGYVGRPACACWRPAVGGCLAGIGGSFLSLYYPGSWNEGLSSGQGLMAVALVIFARWNPMRCLWRLAAVRRRRRARPGAAVGRRHARATTCSTPRPTSSRWSS